MTLDSGHYGPRRSHRRDPKQVACRGAAGPRARVERCTGGIVGAALRRCPGRAAPVACAGPVAHGRVLRAPIIAVLRCVAAAGVNIRPQPVLGRERGDLGAGRGTCGHCWYRACYVPDMSESPALTAIVALRRPHAWYHVPGAGWRPLRGPEPVACEVLDLRRGPRTLTAFTREPSRPVEGSLSPPRDRR
jgi:hypothetical protein